MHAGGKGLKARSVSVVRFLVMALIAPALLEVAADLQQRL
jgi:hypothetical protein